MDSKRVLVAFSGGVDSAVAAALLSSSLEVTALHFTKFALAGLADDLRRIDEKNLAVARKTAARLDIPLKIVETGERFAELIDFFCAEYGSGRTPNPCVRCNATIKWPALLEAADRLGAYYVATGHYARIEHGEGGPRIMRARDSGKDQTYFLHRLKRRALSRTLFPLSDITKDDVRRHARKLGLAPADSHESQEICFVGAEGYRSLLELHTPGALRPGPVLDTSGKQIGMHDGYQLYTIGQRRGLRIALGRPAYVVAIDPETGAVTLGEKRDLSAHGLLAENVNWIAGSAPAGEFRALVKVRYNHPGVAAIVRMDGDAAAVHFEEPVPAVTPGQAAVFYQGDELLGGGWITRAVRGAGEFA